MTLYANPNSTADKEVRLINVHHMGHIAVSNITFKSDSTTVNNLRLVQTLVGYAFLSDKINIDVARCSYALLANTANAFIQCGPNTVFNIKPSMTVSQSFAVAHGSSYISFDSPSRFEGSGFTGKRYEAAINGAINSKGRGQSFIPGSVAGTTASGGQYV